MLSREIMGLFTLGVVWTVALLLAGASWIHLREVQKLSKRMKTHKPCAQGIGMFRARVESKGTLAEHVVHQTGRALDARDGRTIAFWDRAYESVNHGGSLRWDGGLVHLGQGTRIEVWPEPSRQAKLAECESESVFDDVYLDAKTARGHARELRTPVREGDLVWVIAEVSQNGVLHAHDPVILSQHDPLRWVRRCQRIVAAFVTIELGLLAGITAIAFVKPYFGLVSTIGGALGLAFFLGIQPFGNRVRDAIRVPSEVIVRNQWRDRRPLGAKVESLARAA